MIRRLFVLLTLSLVLTGCDDPKRVAQGNAIRRESEALYLATATAVATEKEAADLDIEIRRLRADAAIKATATVTADREYILAQTQAERLARKEKIIGATANAVVTIIVSVCAAFAIVSFGAATAASRKASLESRLIRIPKDTRVWPVLLDTKAGYIVNLETGERARLTDASPANPGQLMISGQVRTTGLLARAAEKIAKSAKSPQPGDMLAAIGQSVPLLEAGDWLPELKERREPDERERCNQATGR